MRKTAIALILVLLITAAAEGQFISLGHANPYIHERKMEGTIPPPEGTKPPEVSIFNPTNETAYPSNNFQLNFTATIQKSTNISLSVSEVYYVASWIKDKTEVDLLSLFRKNNYTWPSAFSINMTGVPEGPHWIEVYAVATGFAYETRHEINGIYYTTYYIGYKITGSSAVNIMIDTVKPRILSFSVANKTDAASNVELNLLTNEPIAQAAYSLDGQTNIMITGNTTLSGLTVGLHNVTVYAWDAAGNVGTSETVSFTVAERESFPAVPVVAVSAAAIAAVIVAAGLLLYNRERRKEAKQT